MKMRSPFSRPTTKQIICAGTSSLIWAGVLWLWLPPEPRFVVHAPADVPFLNPEIFTCLSPNGKTLAFVTRPKFVQGKGIEERSFVHFFEIPSAKFLFFHPTIFWDVTVTFSSDNQVVALWDPDFL